MWSTDFASNLAVYPNGEAGTSSFETQHDYIDPARVLTSFFSAAAATITLPFL